MTGTTASPLRRLLLAPLLAWAALLVLLAVTVAGAYLPIGAWNSALSLAIAAIKALIVAIAFMSLRRSDALLRLAAAAAFFWLAAMFALTFSDYLTRLPLR